MWILTMGVAVAVEAEKDRNLWLPRSEFWAGAFVTLFLLAFWQWVALLGDRPTSALIIGLLVVLSGFLGSVMGRSAWAAAAGMGLWFGVFTLGSAIRDLPDLLRGFSGDWGTDLLKTETALLAWILLQAPIVMLGAFTGGWLRVYQSGPRSILRRFGFGAKLVGGIVVVVCLYAGMSLLEAKTRPTFDDLPHFSGFALVKAIELRQAKSVFVLVNGLPPNEIKSGTPQFELIFHAIADSSPRVIHHDLRSHTPPPPEWQDGELEVQWSSPNRIRRFRYLRDLGVLKANYWELRVLGNSGGLRRSDLEFLAGQSVIVIPLDHEMRSYFDGLLQGGDR